MLETNYLITGINRELVDISTPSERDYLEGSCEITVSQWVKDPKQRYFSKSAATVSLYWLPPPVQDDWRKFEAGVIAHLKEINAQSL